MINPNDPQENPEMFAPPAPRVKPYTEPDEPVHRRAVRPTPDHRVGQEDNEYNDNPGRRNSGGSAHQRGGQGPAVGRSTKHSVGSDQSFDRSPMHPHYQAKVTGKGSASPAWEGKSYDSSHGTPGRSRMKPSRGDDSVSLLLYTLTFEVNPKTFKIPKHYSYIVSKLTKTIF
ncbi:putative RPM1-interacting protein 4/NOI4 [Helianthus annuus]|nr:putative RPM1-interacting protein 4/NOI4 [Helianthus annuus]